MQISPPPAGPPRDRAVLLFWILVALQAGLPWCFHYFPSCDGPSHVHNAEQLWRYLAGDPLLHEYFRIDPRPISNWFGHGLLMLLVRCAGANAGEKLLLSAYFILLPAALQYLLRALQAGRARGAATWLVLAALPLSYNWMLHDGFYFNLLSLPVLFGMLGWWWPRRTRGGAGVACGLAAWLLLLYFTHIVTLVVGLVVLACLLLGERSKGSLGSKLLQLFLAAVPALALLLLFNAPRFGFVMWSDPEVTIPKKIFSLATLYFGLVSFSKRELLISVPIALGLWCLAAGAVVRARRAGTCAATRPWCFAALGVTALFLISPESLAHGWYLVHRLTLYPFFFLLLLVGSVEWSSKLKRGVCVLAVLLTLAQLGFYTVRYHQLQGYLDEYVALGDQIAPRSTLLALGVSNRGHAPDDKSLSERTKPFEFGASRIGLARQCVVLNDYQAHIGYFPLAYKPERDPFAHIGNVLMEPPRFEKGGPAAYATLSGAPPDYVIWWQDHTDKITAQQRVELLAPLVAGYDQVTTSTPHGYGRLYRRKGLERQ